MKISPILFLFSCLFLSFSVYTQDISVKIRDYVESKQIIQAIFELENLKKSDKNLFESNNYDYLLARLHRKNGDFAKAAAEFQSVASRNSILKEYALWHLSQIARDSGNLMLERSFLQELIVFHPNSLLINAAQNRVLRSNFESQNYEAVINMLNNPPTSASNAQPNDEKSRENQLILAKAYLQSGKTLQAKEIFSKLTNNLSNPAQPDDFALEAAKNLDLIEGGNENFGKSAPQIPETEHLRRGAIYQFNRNFALARLHFLAITERFSNGTNVPFASFQIGRGFVQEGDYSSAIEWFERILAQSPSDPVSQDALYNLASAFARLNKPREAVSRYQRYIQQFPDAENLDRAYLNIIDVLRDQGGDNSVFQWTQKTQEVFRGKLAEALALFAQVRIRIEKNDWENALIDLNKLTLFNDLGGTRVPGGTNKTEIAFLKGYALENLQKYAEAIDVYLSIADGRNEYYGWRATERLNQLANSEKTKEFISVKLSALVTRANSSNVSDDVRRQSAQNALRLTNSPEVRSKMLEIIKTTYAILPEYKKAPQFKLIRLGRKELRKEKPQNQNIADELLFLGLYDEAAPEIAEREKGKKSEADKKDVDFTLATYYKRGDWANRAIGLIEPHWKNIPADYQIELIPREQIELLYPTPYLDSILRYAPERKVDPRFVLSIMRQESRFRSDVKSNAAARGLMQFISTTADKIANELNRKNFRQDELYNPPTAILFGSQYLGNLFKIFPNQPQAVAASYNGGEDNVARWLKRANTQDPDRYVAEIVFAQSKDYVYKVLASYRVYQMIYPELSSEL